MRLMSIKLRYPEYHIPWLSNYNLNLESLYNEPCSVNTLMRIKYDCA